MDICSCGATCTQVEDLLAENESLKARLKVMTDNVLSCNAEINDKAMEIERLKAIFRDAALYMNIGDHGHPMFIGKGGVFHHKFEFEGAKHGSN